MRSTLSSSRTQLPPQMARYALSRFVPPPTFYLLLSAFYLLLSTFFYFSVQSWAAELHRLSLGTGYGFNRMLDYHIMVAQSDCAERYATNKSVPLDKYAWRHEQLHASRGYGFHAFASSAANTCPTAKPLFSADSNRGIDRDGKEPPPLPSYPVYSFLPGNKLPPLPPPPILDRFWRDALLLRD